MVSSSATVPTGEDQHVLVTFYRSLIFENPWFDERLPSLVWEGDDGTISGFMGLLPRAMRFRDQAVRTAVATKLMVDPSHRSPFAAIELVRTFLSGPQDLSYSDGATATTRLLWEALGGSVSPAWSMKWVKVLRPCLLGLTGRAGGLSLSTFLARALCTPVDALAGRFAPFHVPEPETTGRPISVSELTGLVRSTVSRFALHPDYDEATLSWLLEFIDSDPDRGPMLRVAVTGSHEEHLGWFVLITNPLGVSDLIAIGARPRSFGAVLTHVVDAAREAGSAAVQGRLWPMYLDEYWDSGCFGKRGAWTIVHARDPQLLRAMSAGNAFLSALEGETMLPLQRPPRGLR